jgi:hypothetical protein
MSCGGFWEGVVNSITYADQDYGDSAGTYYKLVNHNSGLVLGVSGGSLANGAQLVQWTDTGTNDQQWQLVTVSLSPGQEPKHQPERWRVFAHPAHGPPGVGSRGATHPFG